MLSFCKLLILIIFISLSCADDRPFLQNNIKRASDAILIPCDPYGLSVAHSCIIFASTFARKLVVFDATSNEMVLAPNAYFPLPIKVGPATHRLAKITSEQENFPYFLALDQALPALYAVQAFPDKTKKRLSFITPQEQKLDQNFRPFHLAAWQGDDHVYVLLSFRDDKSIGILALDPQTGIIDPKVQPQKIDLGEKPSHIVIDEDRKFALISDQEKHVLHKLDLSNVKNILINPAHAQKSEINIGMPADKIYLQKRDFGEGLKSYAIAFKAGDKELKLINITDDKISSTKKLDTPLQVAYFPDEKSASCCEKKAQSDPSFNNRHWIALADIKGRLTYYLIKNTKNNLKIKANSDEVVNLLDEKNFALGQLMLTSIIGGQVLVDPALKNSDNCAKKNMRKMFFIANFATARVRSWTNADAAPVEEEAQGYSCEGEVGVTRFGHTRE